MSILPIYIWISTIVFTIITILPFAAPTFVFHWAILAACAILAILGWWLIFTRFIH